MPNLGWKAINSRAKSRNCTESHPIGGLHEWMHAWVSFLVIFCAKDSLWVVEQYISEKLSYTTCSYRNRTIFELRYQLLFFFFQYTCSSIFFECLKCYKLLNILSALSEDCLYLNFVLNYLKGRAFRQEKTFMYCVRLVFYTQVLTQCSDISSI